MKNILKIVFVIIGTLVGAGFASGKEIYSFFFIYGKTGIIGMFLSSFLIGLVIYKVLKNCEKNGINSFQDFCDVVENSIINKKGKHDGKNVISKIFNGLVTVFLLIMFYVMISGFSSFLYQEFNLNRLIGSFLIIVLCYFTFIGNMSKLMNVSNYLIPFLIIFIIFISGKSIISSGVKNYIDFRLIIGDNNASALSIIGFVKAILYASYNCIILIPVLVQLSSLVRNESYKSKSLKATSVKNSSVKIIKNNSLIISGVSSGIIFVLSFAIYNLLLQGDYEIFRLDMPLIAISKQIGVFYGIIYTLIIGIAIYTSAASSGVRILK